MDDNWFEDHGNLSEDQKRILYKEMKNFDEYGNAIYQEENLNKIAKKFEAITEYAKRYLNENASDSFDQITINRNVKELEKKVRKFKKEAKKVQQHRERLTALYDDIGLIFDRYFGVGGDENSNKLEESKMSSKDLLSKVIQEKIKEVLNEQSIEFDPKKMEKLAKDDKFLHHTLRDEASNPKNPSNRVLRMLFNSYVLGDRTLERKYKQIR
jgi:regulator of replication initiation timing